MEILDSPESVAKGELLVTTGYHLDQEDKFDTLIHQLRNKGVSGMAVQLGYYIDEVPEYLINQADSEGFPILVIPSQRTFSDILRTLLQRIQHDSIMENDIQETNFLYKSLFQDYQSHPEMSVENDKQTHILLLLKSISDINVDKNQIVAHVQKIRSFLQAECLSCYYHESLSGLIALHVVVDNESSYSTLLYSLNIELTLMSERNDIHFYIGSDILPDFNYLPVAIKHAQECIELLSTMHARRGLCHYNNIPFLKMINSFHYNGQYVVLDNQPLQFLLNYDKTNSTNYTQVLRIYFAENCNVSRTAKRLFVHRHTLLNRLEKIRELCHINLDDYYDRIYLSIALLFHDYFSY